MELTFVTTDAERAEMRRVADAHMDMINGELTKKGFERLPKKIWVDMDGDEDGDHAKFVVQDNRDGQCLIEDFETLDGAMLYACDVYTSCEDQEDWDYLGAMKDGGDIVKRLAEDLVEAAAAYFNDDALRKSNPLSYKWGQVLLEAMNDKEKENEKD